MGPVLTLGRYVFAVTIAGFGVQHIVSAALGGALAPGPPWIAGNALLAGAFGGTLLVTGVGIASTEQPFIPAAVLGVALFVYDALFYFPGIVTHVRDPSNWTRGSEVLAMSGVAFVIAGSAGVPDVRWPRVQYRVAAIGLLLFAVSVFVWAAQHFIYARFTATIVPVWIPWRLFWAVFVGAAFLAASLAFAIRVQSRLAATLLGILFLAIVLVVHVPRVSANPSSGREWTSALVALVMCGASFAVAESRPLADGVARGAMGLG